MYSNIKQMWFNQESDCMSDLFYIWIPSILTPNDECLFKKTIHDKNNKNNNQW